MPFPNVATQWKPGQSGNAKGRPPSLTAKVRKLLDAHQVKGQKIADGREVADLLAEVILSRALKGDMRAVELLWNRIEGKVPDRIAGPDGEDLTIRIAWPDDKFKLDSDRETINSNGYDHD